MSDDDRVVSEEQARRLWQRAAELQAEAAQRLEERSRILARPEGGSDGGYVLAHVRQAAREAGISDEFVELALAEVSIEAPVESRWEHWADRFLGRGPRTLVVSRTLPHAAEEVYASMQRVLPRYRLSLVDSRGRDPRDGGVLVFDLPTLSAIQGTDQVIQDLRMWADIKELHVQIRALDAERCEVTLRAPMTYARKVNLVVGAVLAGVFGVAGTVSAIAMAFGLVGILGLESMATVIVLAMAGLGFSLTAALATLPLRAFYRWGQGKGVAAMERMIQALGVDLRTGGVFQAPPSAPTLPPGQSST